MVPTAGGRRRGRLVLGGIALGTAVVIPIVVWLVRNLNDAANVAQIVSIPLAVASVSGLVLWPPRDGSPPHEQPVIASRGAPPQRRRSRVWAVAGVFAVTFAGVVVANVATGAFLSATGSHEASGPHGPGEPPHGPGGPHGPGEPPHGPGGPRGSMALGPGVYKERPVELSTKTGQESVEIDQWRQVADKSGDLQMDQNGIYTLLGAKLSVIEDSPEPVQSRCAQIQARITRVDFTTLHEGSQLCAQSRGGRYAMLQVRALPQSPGSNGRFIFYGRTWGLTY
jgi:hypothetical protein